MGMDWTAETGRDSRTAETGMDWTAKMGRDSWTAKTGMDWTVCAFPLSVCAFSHSVCTLAVPFLCLPMLSKQCQLSAHISSNRIAGFAIAHPMTTLPPFGLFPFWIALFYFLDPWMSDRESNDNARLFTFGRP